MNRQLAFVCVSMLWATIGQVRSQSVGDETYRPSDMDTYKLTAEQESYLKVSAEWFAADGIGIDGCATKCLIQEKGEDCVECLAQEKESHDMVDEFLYYQGVPLPRPEEFSWDYKWFIDFFRRCRITMGLSKYGLLSWLS